MDLLLAPPSLGAFIVAVGIIVFLVKKCFDVIVNLAASEISDWAPRWAELIVDRAARRFASADTAERYREEWRGELAAIPGRVSRVVVALRIYFNARAIPDTSEPAEIYAVTTMTMYSSPDGFAYRLALTIYPSADIAYYDLGQGMCRIVVRQTPEQFDEWMVLQRSRGRTGWVPGPEELVQLPPSGVPQEPGLPPDAS